MTAKLPISVLIITRNEERNLPECLRSVHQCDQVVVVDSGSSDRTQQLARATAAEVYEHHFTGYAAQKNWAIETLAWRNPWLLFLDADERLSASLLTSLEAMVASPDPADGYEMDCEVWLFGRRLRHSGLSPNWHLRLIRTALARFETRAIDERVIPPARIGRLSGALLHQDRRGIGAWIDRHNTYSDLDARIRLSGERGTGLTVSARMAMTDPALRKRWLKQTVWPRVPCKPVAIFVYMYLLRRGYLDGRAGWRYASMRGFYEMITRIKMEELRLPPVAPAEPRPPRAEDGGSAGARELLA